jgi:xanthine/CO dehydrogenase XdhC/CoxF family maturation factor
MKDRADIVTLYNDLRQDRQSGILATVVKTSGSTYRRPGARMLLGPGGQSAGLISGGCLESDLRERAAGVATLGKPQLITYDSSSGADIVWGLGLGCAGVATILLEPVGRPATDEAIETLRRCSELGCKGAIATVIGIEGKPDASVGDRITLRSGDNDYSDRDRSMLARRLHPACVTAISEGRSAHARFALPAGSADVFVEFVPPAVQLFVFGGGPDAIPLASLAKELGWKVTVVDGRSAFLSRDSFPMADALVLSHPTEFSASVTVPDEAVAVVMTHNFDNDTAIVRTLLHSSIRYIGLLGPKSKTDLLFNRLKEEGEDPAACGPNRLFNPVGLDIGAETPEEIALSIVAEIQSVLRSRPGGQLRLRDGPIHL